MNAQRQRVAVQLTFSLFCYTRPPELPTGLPLRVDVATYGEALTVLCAADLGPLAQVEHFTKRAAGAELNVAIGLARLGLHVGLLSRVGNDSFGRFLLDTLAAQGIDTGAVTVDAQRRTGFYLKARRIDGGDPDIEYFRAGSAASMLSPADDRPDLFGRARHVHLTGVGPAISETSYALAQRIAARAAAAGTSSSFDPNLRPQLWRSRELMIERVNALATQAQWVLPGLEEGRTLTGLTTPADIAAFYLERGVRGVVVKLGADGAYVRTTHIEAHVPAAPVDDVVDTVGAGDGFAVGFISALLEGCEPTGAAARGNLVAGLAIRVSGDCEGLPTRAALQALEST